MSDQHSDPVTTSITDVRDAAANLNRALQYADTLNVRVKVGLDYTGADTENETVIIRSIRTPDGDPIDLSEEVQ